MLPEIVPAMAIGVYGRYCGWKVDGRTISAFTESCEISSCCFIAVARSQCRVVGMMAELRSTPAINVGVPMGSSLAAITVSGCESHLRWIAAIGKR